MKIKLSDIKLGFQNKSFDVLAEDIPSKGVIYKDDLIRCVLSSIKLKENCFNLVGKIKTTLQYECVRCLNLYKSKKSIPFNILLDNQPSINKYDYEKETIDIKSIKSELNLVSYISDIIALSKPMKSLCNRECEGICFICGSNKNKISCECKHEKDSGTWDKLKILDIKEN